MNIDPHKVLIIAQGQVKTTPKKRARKATPTTLDKDSASLQDYSANQELREAIRESLNSMPEIRLDLVEAGRELAADEVYPNAKSLDDLSWLALDEFLAERNEPSSEI
jgi:hypothetical protein